MGSKDSKPADTAPAADLTPKRGGGGGGGLSLSGKTVRVDDQKTDIKSIVVSTDAKYTAEDNQRITQYIALLNWVIAGGAKVFLTPRTRICCVYWAVGCSCFANLTHFVRSVVVIIFI